MQIRMKHADPNATTSLALGDADADGCIMVDASMLESAKAHGWKVADPLPEPEPEPRKRPVLPKDK